MPSGARASCRRAGVPVAVASSSLRERLDRTLARAGLEFEITSPATRWSTASRHPTCSSSPRSASGVDPSRCVVVEDSPPGVAAGRAAGMPTLGVCRVPGTESTLSEADRVVDMVSADEILALGPLGNPNLPHASEIASAKLTAR